MLKRLGLWNCKDTRIGSELEKGLSGGERKRTSIGYELITEPQLLLLDEPTSGLDSLSALKIIKLMKNEARSGKTIVCTIHSPSADAFMLFDRLLLLHDGHQIYQGPTKEITQYLGTMNI
jgi:ABC-type multidrug transport system ATPase subunit